VNNSGRRHRIGESGWLFGAERPDDPGVLSARAFGRKAKGSPEVKTTAACAVLIGSGVWSAQSRSFPPPRVGFPARLPYLL